MIKVAIFNDYESGRIETFDSMESFAKTYDFSDGEIKQLQIVGELDIKSEGVDVTFQLQ